MLNNLKAAYLCERKRFYGFTRLPERSRKYVVVVFEGI